MYFYLASKNLLAKPSRTLLTVIAITICMIFLTSFSAFQDGLRNFLFKNSIQQNPLTELSIKPKGQKLGLNPIDMLPQAKLTPAIIDEMKKIPHVTSIHPQNSVKGISSLQIALLGQFFQTDSLVFGAPYETLGTTKVPKADWEKDFVESEAIPALVSTRLIDLYNYSFASANNLPQITPENFIGTEVTILLNQSTFFGQKGGNYPTLKAKVVGFSPKVKLLGITIPQRTIDQINEQYLSQTEKTFVDAFVEVDSLEHVPAVKTALGKYDVTVSSGEDTLNSLNSYFAVMSIALNTIAIIMFGLAGLMIASTFFAKVTEKTREIGILRALGITESGVRKVFLYEAALIGAFSGLLGFLIALLISVLADKILLDAVKFIDPKPESFFQFSPLLLLWTLIFSIVFANVFAYIPAKQASKLDPIKALSN